VNGLSRKLSTGVLRLFQVLAYAEGALLPTILVVAVYHWITGKADVLVAIVGASHGSVFTAYILIVPLVARTLRWPWRTTSVAFSVAFIPFATWSFERRIHGVIMERIESIKIST
jgi:integral membrane protein